MRAFLFALVVSALTSGGFAQDAPPDELFSPDRRYSVIVSHSALPGFGPDANFFTIAVRNGRHYVAKFPTEGYLLDAFWSPDGKYVAVDNRRANSGDYLWVFRLRDGHAIKMPVDALPPHSDEAYANYVIKAVGRVTTTYPKLTYGQFRKLFVFAHGWTKAGELQVKTNLAFQNLENSIAVIWETDKIEGDKLVTVSRRVEKAPWPLPKK